MRDLSLSLCMFCSLASLQAQQSVPPSPFLPASHASQFLAGWKTTSLSKSLSTTIVGRFEALLVFCFLALGFPPRSELCFVEACVDLDLILVGLVVEIFLFFFVLNVGLVECLVFFLLPV